MCKISEQLKVSPDDVRNVIIWGNSSTTSFPDASHATARITLLSWQRVQIVKVTEAIKDEAYLQENFVTVCHCLLSVRVSYLT